MPNVFNNNEIITNLAVANYVGVNKRRFKTLLILTSATVINNIIIKYTIYIYST